MINITLTGNTPNGTRRVIVEQDIDCKVQIANFYLVHMELDCKGIRELVFWWDADGVASARLLREANGFTIAIDYGYASIFADRLHEDLTRLLKNVVKAPEVTNLSHKLTRRQAYRLADQYTQLIKEEQ